MILSKPAAPAIWRASHNPQLLALKGSSDRPRFRGIHRHHTPIRLNYEDFSILTLFSNSILKPSQIMGNRWLKIGIQCCRTTLKLSDFRQYFCCNTDMFIWPDIAQHLCSTCFILRVGISIDKKQTYSLTSAIKQMMRCSFDLFYILAGVLTVPSANIRSSTSSLLTRSTTG